MWFSRPALEWRVCPKAVSGTDSLWGNKPPHSNPPGVTHILLSAFLLSVNMFLLVVYVFSLLTLWFNCFHGDGVVATDWTSHIEVLSRLFKFSSKHRGFFSALVVVPDCFTSRLASVKKWPVLFTSKNQKSYCKEENSKVPSSGLAWLKSKWSLPEVCLNQARVCWGCWCPSLWRKRLK